MRPSMALRRRLLVFVVADGESSERVEPGEATLDALQQLSTCVAGGTFAASAHL
jgi:hypothetical protein